MTRILLVEDNEMNRDMLSRRLARKGYEVALAVEPHAMQLHLHEVLAVACRVEHHVGGFIELHDAAGFCGRQRRDRVDEPAGQIVEVVIREAVPLGLPDEALLVGKKGHLRPVVDPARR